MGTVITFVFGLLVMFNCLSSTDNRQIMTKVTIKGDQFYINDTITYEGRYWKGNKIEGLLFNSRMVQGIFDDLNPSTRGNFNYPDTGVWDAERNTQEFVDAMPEWKSHGLLCFTLNLQGGSPLGYGNHGWINSAFESSGNIRTDYLSRLEKILNRADEIGMVVILGYFYFGQDEHIKDEQAVLRAVDAVTNWIIKKGYRNILVEINNECDIQYNHGILKPDRVPELIRRVRAVSNNQLLVSTSFSGNKVPSEKVMECSDFILLHGNGINDPKGIKELVMAVRESQSYTQKPVLFNEDDHYGFETTSYNLLSAIESYASWGFFDYRQEGEDYHSGFQSVPVDWHISSERKKAFFLKLKEITGYE
jgi:hypothetical protein